MKRLLVRWATRYAVALTVVAAAGYWIAPADATHTTSTIQSLFPRGMPWALTEDSCVPNAQHCVWDAKHNGNGRGHSLILTKYRGGWLWTPISHWDAHRLQAKWCRRPQVSCGID